MTFRNKTEDSVGIGTKYFVKYTLLFAFLPLPMIIALASKGGGWLLGAISVLILFLFPVYVRLRYPYFCVVSGELVHITPWGGEKVVGSYDQLKVQISSHNIKIISSDGRSSTLERADFFRPDWDRMHEFISRQRSV